MNYEPTMLDIGHSKQIFVDDLVIESVENICRTWHQPTRGGSPVIVRDRPWEQITYLTFNGSRVVRDPRDGIFKCVYQIWNRGDTPHDPPAFHLLYAESEDGVHWRKPELDVFQHDGRDTNIVIPNAYGMDLHSRPSRGGSRTPVQGDLPQLSAQEAVRVHLEGDGGHVRGPDALDRHAGTAADGPDRIKDGRFEFAFLRPLRPDLHSEHAPLRHVRHRAKPGQPRTGGMDDLSALLSPGIGAASTNGGSGRRRAPT